ncbi:carbon-nitrogen hydrolase [Rhizoctonia solani]|nr:carbon-nitrogen hydrolase [Rhizoctonia solani]
MTDSVTKEEAPLHVPLRVGLVQFDPKVENVEYNIKRVKERIASLEPGTVDLICLPEMAFTGYVFPTAESILPFVEHPDKSPSRDACAEIAQRLKCYVVAGYPASTEDASDPAGGTKKSEGTARNNAIVVDPNGQVIHEYTKTNMFETDLPWAQPGSGFTTFTTPLESLGTVSVAICMDLNPHPPNVWTSVEGPYELADYCIEHNVQTLILLCAWLDSGVSPEDTQFDAQTVSYWIARLRPLWYSGSDKYTVIISNRTGTERGSKFAGSSTVLRSQANKHLPKILTVLGREEEAVRVVDISE